MIIVIKLYDNNHDNDNLNMTINIPTMAIHDNYHHLNMTKRMMTLIIIPVLPGAGCTFVFEQRSILAEPEKISTSTFTHLHYI